MVTLTHLNYAAALLHLVQAVVVGSLIPGLDNAHANEPSFFRGVYPVLKNLLLLRNTDAPTAPCDLPLLRNATAHAYTVIDDRAVVAPHAFVVGHIDVRYLLVAFFALSSGFQFLEAFLLGEAYARGPRLLRFVEYAFSASVMLLAMAVQVGITDIYTLCCMFALMVATNGLGLIAEALCFVATRPHHAQELLPLWSWLAPHCLAWLTCLCAYAPLIDAYLATNRCSDRHPPGYVDVIIFLEFGLFSCFGLVQLYALVQRSAHTVDDAHHYYYVRVWLVGGSRLPPQRTPDEAITYGADLAYVTLSFTAKTLLAWLILAPILTLHPSELFV